MTLHGFCWKSIVFLANQWFYMNFAVFPHCLKILSDCIQKISFFAKQPLFNQQSKILWFSNFSYFFQWLCGENSCTTSPWWGSCRKTLGCQWKTCWLINDKFRINLQLYLYASIFVSQKFTIYVLGGPYDGDTITLPSSKSFYYIIFIIDVNQA